MQLVREQLGQARRPEPQDRAERQQAILTQKELEHTNELIRQQYLGKEKTKRRVCKANEKFRCRPQFCVHSVFPFLAVVL